MKSYVPPMFPVPENVRCSAHDGGAHNLCDCGNQPPIHCMYCIEDLSDQQVEQLEKYYATIGPQPYTETRQDGHYLHWDGEEVGPFATPEEAFKTIGILF